MKLRKAWALALAVFLTGAAAMASATYTVARTCNILYCSASIMDSQGAPAGHIEYGVTFANGGYFGNTTFWGNYVFNGTTYTDFQGTFTGTNGNWVLAGVFDESRGVAAETFSAYCRAGRGGGCSITNLSGTVTH